MTKIALLLCSALWLNTNAQVIVYAKDPEPGFAQKKISAAQMQEDVLFWHKVMEESHVNLYHAISKDSLLQMERGLLGKITDSISQQDAVLLIGKLAAALNEGHIGLPSSRITDSFYTNSLRFPYLLQKVEDNRWVIDRDISQEQKLGINASILSVNGIPVSELTSRFMKYYGGLETWRKQQVATNIRKLLFLSGIQSPYRISAETEDGRRITFTTDGFTKQQGDSINKVISAGTTQRQPYSFTMLDNGIAYINYRSMSNAPSNPFEDFLKQSFSEIQRTHAKGLIVDLRENSGGNSVFGKMLVSYFTEKPFLFAKGMKWKISPHYKIYTQKANKNVLSADAAFYNSMKDGDMYTWENTLLDTPAKNNLLFKGKVAVLIGPNTFSSANMLADGIKSYRLATLFGEPTGESGNDFGEMYNFMLPNSCIIARASTKMFTRADGDEKNFDPVLPDILVVPSAADLKQKKDVVLERAATWILQ